MRFKSPPRVRVYVVLLILPIFTMGCLAWPAILSVAPSTLGRMPNLLAASPTPGRVIPTVPPSGSPINVTGTYFHTSGVLSIPQIDGWPLAANNPEEKLDPYAGSKISRAGVTFINTTALSVIHAFVEHDPNNTAKTIKDLNGFFNKAGLDAAWANYTGGWKELNRRADTDKGAFVINLELRLEGNVYLARMLARMEQGWLVELRLVVPQNNPDLLENLNAALWPQYKFWLQGTTTPMYWTSIIDQTAGYVIKIPPDWRIVSGEAGEPFSVQGAVSGNYVFMTTSGVADQSVTSKDQAAAWVKSSHPDATKIVAKAGGKTNRYEFLVTYTDVDPNNTPSSGLVGFVNGNNKTLYAVDIQYGVAGLNLANELDTNVPFVLSQVRSSFFVIASGADQKAGPTPTIAPTSTAAR